MMTVAAFINHQLQCLRDMAEGQSRSTAELGDRDSADAFERIGLAIDECLQKTKHDITVANERVGLMERSTNDHSPA